MEDILVYTYDISCIYRNCLQGFEECTKTEIIFYEEMKKFPQTKDITKANIAFIPIFMASLFYKTKNQEQFNNYWKNIFEKILAPMEIRKNVPHFVLYNYVLNNINFSCIPNDIKIIAYESEVTISKLYGLFDNGCSNRMIITPYILDTQPGYSKTIRKIVKNIYHDKTDTEIIKEFDRRGSFCLVGNISDRNIHFTSRRIIANKLKTKYSDLVIESAHDDFTATLTKFKFCLVLRGDTPTRKAFYTALSGGCIPVIFERELLQYDELYAGSLDIKDIVVTIPDYKENDSVYLDQVMDILSNAVSNKDEQYRKVIKIPHIFNEVNYFNSINGISAPVYNSVLAVMNIKKRLPNKMPFIYLYDIDTKYNKKLLPVYISPTEILTEDYTFGKKNDNLYQTSQYALETIFFEKIKNYPYLTKCLDKANIAYIPNYTFLSTWSKKQYFYSCPDSVNQLNSLLTDPIMKSWHTSKIPHILVYGDVMWNDNRVCNNHIKLPDNTYTLTLESLPANKHNNKLITVPYPTEFHFSTSQLLTYFENTNRNTLLTYVGRLRSPVDLLQKIVCKENELKIKILDNAKNFWISTNNWDNTKLIFDLYTNSVFSLQPYGDMGTRRGFYHSLLLGSIPVIFSKNLPSYQSLFNGIIDIRNIAVILEDINTKDIINILNKISNEEREKYKKNIKDNLAKLQYSLNNDDDDAFYNAIKCVYGK
jgi:hypothetical protein